MIRPDQCRWRLPLSFLVSGILHLGLALALLWPETPGAPTAAGDGDQVVGVTLAMFGQEAGDAFPPSPQFGSQEESAPDSDPQTKDERDAEQDPSPAPEPKQESTPEPVAGPEPEPEPESEVEPKSSRETASPAAPDAAETVKASPRPESEPKAEPVSEAPAKSSPPTRRQPKTKAVSQPKPPPAPKPKPPPKKPKRSSGKSAQTADKAAKSKVQRGRRGEASGTAGSGGGSAGRGGETDPAAESRYLSELQRAIARHRLYPREAQKRELEGVVTVSFVILADGRIRDVRVAKSSGSALLDKGAIETLKRLGAFKPIPREIGRSRWPLRVPIRFALR